MQVWTRARSGALSFWRDGARRRRRRRRRRGSPPPHRMGWFSFGEIASRKIASLAAGELLPITGGTSGRCIFFSRLPDGALAALDNQCAHMGASLAEGIVVDIEDSGSAVVCPAHGRAFSLTTGQECAKRSDGVWVAQGAPRQRVLPVEELDGVVRVYLGGEAESACDSDRYNLRVPAAAATRTAPQPAGRIQFAARRHEVATAAIKSRTLRHEPSTPATQAAPGLHRFFPPAAAAAAVASLDLDGPDGEGMDVSS